MGSPQNPPEKPRFSKWQLASLGFELGFIIALPLVALGTLGKWLDGKWNTYPWFTLIGILLAIISTTIWLSRKFKDLMKR